MDECHRVAGTPTAVTQFSKVLSSLATRHKYGLSAAVHRVDGIIAATYALLGKIAYQVSGGAVTDKIMTTSVLPRPIRIGLSKEFLDTDGTIIHAKLINCLAEDFRRSGQIVGDFILNAEHYNLVLSGRLARLEYLAAHLPKHLRDQVVMVNGKMTFKKDKTKWGQVVEDIRAGRKHYLFAACALVKEGLDIPRLDRLYPTTPRKDYVIITQSVGHIARIFGGKGGPVAYDYVDNGIQYLVRSYRKQCTSYRKYGCKILE